jgi:hypothetical protein
MRSMDVLDINLPIVPLVHLDSKSCKHFLWVEIHFFMHSHHSGLCILDGLHAVPPAPKANRWTEHLLTCYDLTGIPLFLR